MRPQRARNGKTTLNDARMPGDVEVRTRKGVLVLPGPVYGAWDVYADDDTRQFSAERLLGRDGRSDERSASHTAASGERGRELEDAAGPLAGASASAALADTHADWARGQAGAAAGREIQSAARSGEPSRARKLSKVEIRIRRQTQTALALRAEGWTLDDIAAHLGIARPTLTGWFTAHRRQVTAEEIDSVLDQTAVPLATENLIHGLLEGDKDYTLEVLKGRGALRRHGESDKAPSTALPELVIRFEAPAGGAALPITATGSVSGVIAVPKQIEGRVVESRPLETPDVGTGTIQVPRAPESAEGAGR